MSTPTQHPTGDSMRWLAAILFVAAALFFANTACGNYFRGSSSVDTLPRADPPCSPDEDAGQPPRDASADRHATAR